MTANNNGIFLKLIPAQQRFGSQSSLQQRNPELHHASPRIVGTPQVSATGGPQQRSMSTIMTSPTGPEKPQRLFEDNNKQRSISQGNPPRGVRFQDPKEEENNKVSR